jgi:ParB/RepB/Spo0J family partition protein
MNSKKPTNDDALEWEINSTNLIIKESNVVLLPIHKLSPHPDNRPLGTSVEKLKQLKILIAHEGFDSSHPLVVRPYINGYQIIEGEHRYKVAKSLGYLQLPCVVRELSDTEALIQLVLGNIQTESKPLEIGINALQVIQKEGYSIHEYAKRLGVGETTLRRYMSAGETFKFIKAQLPEGAEILDEVYKLEEIHRCPHSDWIWFHDLVMKNELSKNQVIEISQAIREVKTDNPIVYQLFDFINLRQEIAQQILKGNSMYAEQQKDLIKTIESSYQNLDPSITLYEYNVLNDSIDKEDLNLKEHFITQLKGFKALSKQNTLDAYKDALQLKRTAGKEEAERTAQYFRDKKNEKEREEQERIEKAIRQIKSGDWWQLGEHRLFCGDGAGKEFYEKLPEISAFIFCNPPYFNSSKPQDKLLWQMDWMIEKAEVVAVTPPLEQLQLFLTTTRMPYKWSMSAHLNLKKGEGGSLGNWIYTALFAKKNVHTRVRDAWQVDSSDLQGNKTYQFMKHLVESFAHEYEKVIDLYAGLGTMFMVAEETHRICYGAEIDPTACKQIIEKWEELSKEKARRIGV